MPPESDRTRAGGLIIGVGTENGDDAFGLLVARYLAPKADTDCRIIEHSGEGASLMEAWQGFDRVVIVDTTQSGSNLGDRFRFDIHSERIPTRFFHYSTHYFSVAEAIETARVLGRLPSHMVVLGVEGTHFKPGTSINPALESIIPAIAEEAVAELALA